MNLRANHGVYVSDAYNPQGDRIAAQRNDLSYQALVLATTPLDLKSTLAAAPVSKDKEPVDTTKPVSAPANPVPTPNPDATMPPSSSAVPPAS